MGRPSIRIRPSTIHRLGITRREWLFHLEWAWRWAPSGPAATAGVAAGAAITSISTTTITSIGIPISIEATGPRRCPAGEVGMSEEPAGWVALGGSVGPVEPVAWAELAVRA